MPEIFNLIITETGCREYGWTVSLKIDSEETTLFEWCDLQVWDPYSEAEATNLCWYFQESLENPFVERVKFDKTAQSIFNYGEALFQQLLPSREVQDVCSRYLSEDISLCVLVHGGPTFQSLHWEALKHPSHDQPFSLRASFERRVSDISMSLVPRSSVPQAQPPSKLNILLVVARPKGARDVGYRSISRPLIDYLSQSHVNCHVDLVRPGTVSAFEAQLNARPSGFYDVVHFDLHGVVTNYGPLVEGHVKPYHGTRAFLLFQLADGPGSDWLDAHRVAEILTGYGVKAAIINACQSSRETGEPESSLASVLSRSGISFVLGMCYNITVNAAVSAVVTMYAAFVKGKSWSESVTDARRDMWRNKERTAYYGMKIPLEDWLLPVAYVNAQTAVKLTDLPGGHHASPISAEISIASHASRYRGPHLLYEFVGRDIDILEVERRLLSSEDSNQLIIKGMMGAGKTSFLHHIAEWWQKTGLVEKVFYFEYRGQAWTVPLLMNSIARQIYSHASQEYQQFDVSPLLEQQRVVVEWLSTTRHLLILDNMEAISMTNSNAQLSYKEMAALARFLKVLSGTRSIILLGSRNNLERLNFPPERIYSLRGLDLQAVSLLVSRILHKLGKSEYLTHPSIRELTDRLRDSPLALQMVLANVERKHPSDVMQELNSGLVSLDNHEGFPQNDQSLHSYIEYACTNLPEQDQKLLLCLAPFVCHLVRPNLNDYGKVLGNQPALATFPVTSLPRLLQSIEYTGLISLHQDNRDWLIMQPILPAFLYHKLNDMPEIRAAIDKAFCEHSDSEMRRLYKIMMMGNTKERRTAEDLIGFQFESIRHALELRLKSGRGFYIMLEALNTYLRHLSNTERGIEFSRWILLSLSKMSGQMMNAFEIGAIYLWSGKWMMLRRNYTDAEEYFQLSLRLLEESHSRSTQPELLNSAISNIYECLGDIRRSQGKHEEAEAEHKKASASRPFQTPGEPFDAVTRGLLALKQRDYDLASELFREAHKESLDHGKLEGEAAIVHLFNRASAEFGKENLQNAMDLYTDALELCDEYQDVHKAAKIHYELAQIMCAQGDSGLAHKHVSDALATFTILQIPDKRANCYCVLARLARDVKEWTQAEEYCLKAIEIGKDEKVDRDHAGLAYYAYGETLRPQGKRAAAQEQYEIAYGMLNPGPLRASAAYTLGLMANANKQHGKAKKYLTGALDFIQDKSTEPSTKAAYFFELGDAVLQDRPPDVPMAERMYWQALAIYINLGDSKRRGVVESRLKHVVSTVNPACRNAYEAYEAITEDEGKTWFALDKAVNKPATG